MIKEKNKYTYIHIVFVIIFKCIFIYLLHVFFVFKIKGIFGKKIPTQKCAERAKVMVHKEILMQRA